jgi:catechol 2,3-dioxygenase-like lactoylglutathione lyase family enzyme
MPPVRGLRHLALKVRDVRLATRFYCDTFGMRVVWEPRPRQRLPELGERQPGRCTTTTPPGPGGSLDHLGFLMGSADDVFAAADALRARGVPLAHEPRTHRDGSVSCYLATPTATWCRSSGCRTARVSTARGFPAPLARGLGRATS